MSVERHPGSISGLSDDELATIAVSLAIAELQWSPDVAPAALDRISRDAVAYPEQFDRRATSQVAQVPPPTSERSAKRAFGRLAVFGAILVVIIGVVAFAATASAVADEHDGLREWSVNAAWERTQQDELVAGLSPFVPIGAIDGTLMSFGDDERGELNAVDQGGRILHVVTEAS